MSLSSAKAPPCILLVGEASLYPHGWWGGVLRAAVPATHTAMKPPFVWHGRDRSPCHVWIWLAGLPQDPQAQRCIHRMLEGQAERVRAELQSKGQGHAEGSGLGESIGQSWSSPTACYLHFSAHGKIHPPLKTTPPSTCPTAQLWLRVLSGCRGMGWEPARSRQRSREPGGALPLFGAAHRQRKPLLPGQSHGERQVPAFCLRPHLKAGQAAGAGAAGVPRYSRCPAAGTW